MKKITLTHAYVMSGLLIGTQFVGAVTSDNPYLNAVTGRNLFALKPPPDPASLIPQVQAPPLPNVLLAGITTLMGNTRAVLRVPRAARPPEPPKEISLFLSPGGPAEEGVKVLEINIVAGTVKIDNNGTVQDLDMTNNAPKSAPVAAPAAAAPMPVPGLPVPPRPPGFAAPAPGAGITSVGRPLRGGSSDGVVGGGPVQMGNPAAPQALTLEEQTIMIEVNRMKEPDLPFPSTDLSETLQQEQGAGSPPSF